ncbi:hypothetical protein WJX72_011211 [[Myrmecia] bisecta]|uniref:XRCC4 coiled-coil domain-containing protein n=1 Tax=[Myrmecia] bisecta TaxID=41462 RepID=A0AAW1PQR7_9CHLO
MLTCKKLTGGAGASFYALVDFHENADDIELSRFDITVTDGVQCWQLTGRQKAEKENANCSHWMAYMKDALMQPDSPRFTWTFVATPQSLSIRCKFKLEERGDEEYAARLELAVREDRQAAVRDFLDTMLLNMAALQDAHSVMVQQCQAALQEVAISKTQVEEFVKTKQQREEDMYVKFSAILNEKKVKAAEWKQRAEAAEARLQREQGEDATPSGSPARSEQDSEATERSDDEQVEATMQPAGGPSTSQFLDGQRQGEVHEEAAVMSSLGGQSLDAAAKDAAPMEEDATADGNQMSYLDMPTQPIEEDPAAAECTAADASAAEADNTLAGNTVPAPTPAPSRLRPTVRRKRR